MDCRKFRDRHALFLDNQVSALEEFELRSHMRYCAACARLDAVLRRGRLLVRNLPEIEPSAGFRARLDARLRADQVADRFTDRFAATPAGAGARVARYAAAAALLVAVTLVTGRAVQRATSPELRLPPVVASVPAHEPSPFGNTGLVATVATGMSIWPAVMMASQAPVHLVAAESAAER